MTIESGARTSRRPRTVTGVLTRLVLRRWAVALGTSVRGLAVGAAAVFLVIAGGGGVLADRVGARAVPAPAGAGDLALLGVFVSVFAVGSGFGIFAAYAVEPGPSLGFLRTMPVSGRQVRRAAALPVLVLAMAGAVAFGPATVEAARRLSGRPTALVFVAVALAMSSATAIGVLLHRGATRLFGWARLAPLRLTGAYLGWCALLALSLVAPLPLLHRAGSAIGLAVLAPLGWPLPWWVAVDPSPAVGAAALASCSLLVAGAVAAPLAPPRARRAARPRPRPRAGGRLPPTGRWPVIRLELARLRRHAQVLEAVVVSSFLAAAVVVASAWATRRPGTALPATTVGLLAAQVAAAFAALARGLSARRRPCEAALAISPARHVLSLYGAAFVLAAAGALPAVVAAALWLPAAVLLVLALALPPLVAIAVVVSEVTTPELGSGSAEGGAVLAFAAASTVPLAATDHLAGPVAVAGGAGLAVAALAAAVLVERMHRRPS